MKRSLFLVFVIGAISLQADGGTHGNEYLPGTQPLTSTEDFPVAMATGIERYFDREIVRSVKGRERFWAPDFSSAQKYEASVAENRARFARIIGLVDARVANPELEYIATTSRHGLRRPLARVRRSSRGGLARATERIHPRTDRGPAGRRSDARDDRRIGGERTT
jgi:hypothetical protein